VDGRNDSPKSVRKMPALDKGIHSLFSRTISLEVFDLLNRKIVDIETMGRCHMVWGFPFCNLEKRNSSEVLTQ
jgi:hypothetical protein